jgi:hypothetical protein
MDFCEAYADEVLYGGAAGGGKTDCLIMEATRYVDNPRYKALILRRTFPQLQEIMDRCREYYPLIGGEYRAGEHRWYFPSGASVTVGHMQNAGDEYNYQGKEFSYIGFDEACQFLPQQYLYLFSRCRSTDSELPSRIRAATNPGGVGHQFMKDRFRIGHVLPGTTIRDDETGMTRVFIPAKLADNPSLAESDPQYVSRLMQLPEIERLRLMEGNWDSFTGQAFPELSWDIHGFDFDVPLEWERFATFDWGFAKPWVYILWAVDYEGKIYAYKMRYGCKPGEPDMGLRQTDTEIGREIRIVDQGEPKIRMRAADPSIWNKRTTKDGILGPAPVDGLMAEGLHFVKADNDRILGWQQLHHRLKIDDEDGRPGIYFHRSLDDIWRTLPLMRHSEKRPEDLETDKVEDHIPDCIRYAVMTRPIRPRMEIKPDVGSFQYERRKLIRARQMASRYGIGLSAAYGRV